MVQDTQGRNIDNCRWRRFSDSKKEGKEGGKNGTFIGTLFVFWLYHWNLVHSLCHFTHWSPNHNVFNARKLSNDCLQATTDGKQKESFSDHVVNMSFSSSQPHPVANDAFPTTCSLDFTSLHSVARGPTSVRPMVQSNWSELRFVYLWLFSFGERKCVCITASHDVGK